MCLACLEAELWLAYQEDLAAREKAAAGQEAPAGAPVVALAVAPAAAPSDLAKPRMPPDRPAAPFACEEPPST
jgi:hypothetical protein